MKKLDCFQEHIATLGKQIKDKATGLTGKATNVSFDLYGRAQFLLEPYIGVDGKKPDGHWFDVERVEITD